jgi:hypothetical protein
VCLCQADVALSALVDGNPDLRVLRYKDAAELIPVLEDVLRGLDSRPVPVLAPPVSRPRGRRMTIRRRTRAR